MARRKDLIYSFLSSVEKEARRAAKEQERINRLQEKERQKRAVINRNKQIVNNTTEQAVRVVAERPCVEYLSLIDENYIGLPKDIIILPDAVNFLKRGKRVQAIKYYKEHSQLEYNEIIETIKYLESNLNIIIEDYSECRFEDSIGKYEFCPLQEVISYRQINNYDSIAIELTCEPLLVNEIISSKNPTVIQNKVQTKIKQLANQWNKKFHKYHEGRENDIIKTIYYQLNNILSNTIKYSKNIFQWDDLKDNALFKSQLPIIEKPNDLTLKDTQILINEIEKIKTDIFDESAYKFNIFEKFLNLIGLKLKAEKSLSNRILEEKQKWEENNKKTLVKKEALLFNIQKENENAQKTYEIEISNYNKYLNKLKKEEEVFLSEQREYNNSIDKLIAKFNHKDSKAIEIYFENVLESSLSPVLFYKDFSIVYNNVNNLLEIDYVLPRIEDVYNIKSISLIASRNEYKVNYITQKQQSEIYDSIIYQLCFKTLYEIFNADKNNYISGIVFNGYSKNIDKKDGREKTICIMSIQISKEKFNDLDLLNIEPKACFKSLKGISAVELATLTPIRPILQFNKNDNRFTEAYEVMDYVEEGYNLATMNWQDFENLVREIFEKEFSENGSEVKITQASRDEGVDAVVYDPDPIRGGKIIIQAKCYTNIVGVSAVRDLFGTVHSEGAIKGILITTSDYGADSYEYAKDKPLTLLNGNNLLHLLEKHGHKARINLSEAKMINKQLVAMNYYLQEENQIMKIHRESCIWLNKSNLNFLGNFNTYEEALNEARKTYSNVEICEKCCSNSIINQRG